MSKTVSLYLQKSQITFLIAVLKTLTLLIKINNKKSRNLPISKKQKLKLIFTY